MLTDEFLNIIPWSIVWTWRSPWLKVERTWWTPAWASPRTPCHWGGNLHTRPKSLHMIVACWLKWGCHQREVEPDRTRERDRGKGVKGRTCCCCFMCARLSYLVGLQLTNEQKWCKSLVLTKLSLSITFIFHWLIIIWNEVIELSAFELFLFLMHRD